MPAQACPRRIAVLALALLGTGVFSGTSAGAERIPVAVIVHKQVPVNELSLSELRRVFRGERHSWSEDLTITLLTPPQGSPERKVLLNDIYQQRSEVQYQQYWINKLFGEGPSISPKITRSTEMSASLVREIPGAIALVSAYKIPSGVKVLRIDGKRPGQSGYPLVTSG
jgi:ABC-type phosphate transport system substrate-binding protein